MNWSPVAVGAWAVFGLVFLVLEFGGLRREHDGWPPLTQVFGRWVPAPFTMALLSWLWWHGLETYGLVSDGPDLLVVVGSFLVVSGLVVAKRRPKLKEGL